MKILIMVVITGVVLGLGLWHVFYSFQPTAESRLGQYSGHYRALQEIK